MVFVRVLALVFVFVVFVFVLVFLLFLVLAVAVVEVEVAKLRGSFQDGSGLGKVDAFGGGFGGTDDVGVAETGAKPGSVGRGDLQTVGQGRGSLAFEVAGGEGVDDDGEIELDGLAVFQRGQFDVPAREEIASAGLGAAEAALALVETIMEVAMEPSGQGWGSAL